ncbi:MAG: Virginiamycin B lyase [Candidatus Methanolliviera sp. GoM_oil]|nr:MAG: Virginiamycin B lyase [Candidatus Methanolliviera sp. GoM_oil]
MKNDTKNSARKPITAILFAVVMIASVLALVSTATAFVCSKTYTADADFDEGTLVGVEHTTVHNQLQLSEESGTLPFIWVPNNEGTVSKVDTETGDELGRYWVSDGAGSPSRTTVDLDGNCWVGNRARGTVVKIGLYEAGQYIDRNGDGVIQTSQDLNDDGDITGDEILLWGDDECVLYEVVLISGKEGTYAPGTYSGGYDYDSWSTSPRGLAVDASNNLWAGTWNSMKYYYIDGSTGEIQKTVDVSAWNHQAYGAVIDGNGILWSSGQQLNHVLRMDPSTDTPTTSTLDMEHYVYGLGLDYLGHLFVAGWCDNVLSRVDITTATTEWTKPTHMSCSRGVVSTDDNNIWVANSGSNTVTRYDNEGSLQATISGFNAPSGVAVDAAGKVWGTDISGNYIHRIDPETNTIDLSKQILGSGGHYTYSDMTGIVVRTITTKIGTWTVIFDSERADTPWGTVSWNSDEPAGTSITVKVRSSNDMSTWSSWETATNGDSLSSTPDGRYIEIETTLQILSGDDSPVLYDLTVECGNQPPVVIEAYPSEECLWPPNQKFVDITIEGVTDPDGDEVTITITGITSDEPTAEIEGAGGDKHAPDADGVGTDTASVRAERSGTGNGRVYEITFVASDGIAETVGSVFVKVPHDQSDDCESIDDGQDYDATAIN